VGLSGDLLGRLQRGLMAGSDSLESRRQDVAKVFEKFRRRRWCCCDESVDFGHTLGA
jgi:hypothetical protein